MNQKSRKLLFFTIVWLLCLTSCKRINCPEFYEEMLRWIQKDDVIELYSHSKDSTIILSISSVEITHTTHYPANTDCACEDYIYVNSYDSNFSVKMFSHNDQSYRIFDTDFSTYSEAKNYLFENNTYDLVRIFDRKNSGGKFRKLIIAKDTGVVGLIDVDGDTWVLKTGVKIKKLDKQDRKITIKNTSC